MIMSKRFLLSGLLFCVSFGVRAECEVQYCEFNSACTIQTVFWSDSAPEDLQPAPTFADADITHIGDAGTEATGVVQAADITDEGQSMSIALAAGDVNYARATLIIQDQTATKTYMDKCINIFTYGNDNAALPGIGNAAPITAAELNAEVADVVKTDQIADLSQGTPPGTPTFEQALMYLYSALRNRLDVDNTLTEKQFFNDAGTLIWKKSYSDSGTEFSETEGVTGP